MPVRDPTKIKPGEIWWVELSIKENSTVGHETKKTRPCLVLANCPEAKMITSVPFQSNLEALKLPYTQLIRKNSRNKLKNDSVLIVFQMRSLDYLRFRSRIGVINEKELKRIKSLVREFLNL
jgi:mRNA-degrading endonuclease toxin of MazEF toxin-antitoxin module